MADPDRADYTHPVGAALAGTLLGVGLYVEAFEGVVFVLRLAVQDHRKVGNSQVRGVPDDLLDPRTSAAKTIAGCRVSLVAASVLTEAEFSFLQEARIRRNTIVHDALRRAFLGPDLVEVRTDVERLITVARRLEAWQRTAWPAPPPGEARTAIAFSELLQSSLAVSLTLADAQLSNRASADPSAA